MRMTWIENEIWNNLKKESINKIERINLRFILLIYFKAGWIRKRFFKKAIRKVERLYKKGK